MCFRSIDALWTAAVIGSCRRGDDNQTGAKSLGQVEVFWQRSVGTRGANFLRSVGRF